MNKDNIVEQRKVEIGPVVDSMRVIEKGLTADDRVVVSGPGQKVDPQMQTAADQPSPSKTAPIKPAP